MRCTPEGRHLHPFDWIRWRGFWRAGPARRTLSRWWLLSCTCILGREGRDVQPFGTSHGRGNGEEVVVRRGVRRDDRAEVAQPGQRLHHPEGHDRLPTARLDRREIDAAGHPCFPKSPPAQSSPMSSFQISGCSSMNRSIEIHASRRVDHDDLHARPPEPLDPAAEVPVLADEDLRDAELPDQAAAVPAGGQGGYHGRAAVALLAAGLAEGVGLPVDRGIVLALFALSDRPVRCSPLGR